MYVLGVIAFPTAMYQESPLECTFCTRDLCPDDITNKMVIDTIIFFILTFLSKFYSFLGWCKKPKTWSWVGHHLSYLKISTDSNHIVFQSTRPLLFNLYIFNLFTNFNLNKLLYLILTLNNKKHKKFQFHLNIWLLLYTLIPIYIYFNLYCFHSA